MCRSQARSRPLDGFLSGSPLAADSMLDRRLQAHAQGQQILGYIRISQSMKRVNA
jgi:hypothetical protein